MTLKERLEHGVLVPEPPDYNAILNYMTGELEQFCKHNELPYLSADELLLWFLEEGPKRKTPEQGDCIIHWIQEFIERWDYAEERVIERARSGWI